MHIYTYYEDVNFNQQDELIDVWFASWSKMGFTPIILTRSDAEKHPHFRKYVKSLQEINLKITGEPLKPYSLSCFLRWLAYATIDNKNQVVLASDYDVINMGVGIDEFTDRYADNKINFYSYRCPCFVSGTPKQFQELCHMFVDIPFENIKECKKLYKEQNVPIYHDNTFTIMYEEKLKYKIRFSKDGIHTSFEGLTSYSNKLVHFSHFSVQRFRDELSTAFKNTNNGALRIAAIKECCLREGIEYNGEKI